MLIRKLNRQRAIELTGNHKVTSFVQSSPAQSAAHQRAGGATFPEISYGEALNQGLRQAMELNEGVVVLGQLVDYSPGVFGSTTGLVERFGAARVRDFPVSESAMTAAAIGGALAGLRPVLVHHRLDFMLYSMDAIVNWMALWRFKSNRQSALPIVIRAIVGRGWGQGPQHSKSLHAWFAHVPGIKVAMPATAYDAKGLLLESIFGQDPVIIIEHRSLFSFKGGVPEEPYRVRFGQAAVRRNGKDLTIVAAGAMVPFALRVAGRLASRGVDSDVIDVRTVSPLDIDTICLSVEKTGRLCVMDPAWQSFGVSAEIITRVVERSLTSFRAAPVRICYPNSHTPMSSALEAAYYPDESEVVEKLVALSQR
jgi:pyruvate dehydrogenase E1 component beta subunit